MKIRSLYCPVEHSEVPLDHYTSGKCEKMPMPLPWLNGILNDILGDTLHCDGRVTATRLLTCPREIVLQDYVPSSVDLTNRHMMFTGTQFHRILNELAPEGTYRELVIPQPDQPPVTVFGIPMYGKIDHITADGTEIHDYKMHAESAQKWQPKAELDDAVQLNIYRILKQKAIGGEVKKLVIWHGAMCRANGPAPWIRDEKPFLTEEQMLQVKPRGSKYTIRQNIEMLQQFQRDLAEGKNPEDIIRTMPLVGREMFRGTKCTRYCGVDRECDRLEGIARI